MLTTIQQGVGHLSFIPLSLSPPPLCLHPHRLTSASALPRSISTEVNLILHLSVLKLGLLFQADPHGHLQLMIWGVKKRIPSFWQAASVVKPRPC